MPKERLTPAYSSRACLTCGYYYNIDTGKPKKDAQPVPKSQRGSSRCLDCIIEARGGSSGL